MRIAFLRNELAETNTKLMGVLDSEWSASKSIAVRELRDRIFGYRIEIAALQVRAHRLLKQARDQDTAHV